MNGYERVKAALRGENVDYQPVMVHNFQMCVREAGIHYDIFRNDPRKAAEAFIRNAEKYDLDGIFIDVDTATLAGACGCKVTYSPDAVGVTTGGIIDDIEEAQELIVPNIEQSIHVQNWLDVSRIVSEYFKGEKYIRCNCDQAAFSLASMLRGSQEFMMDLMDEEEEENILCLLDYSEAVTEQFVKLAAQTGADGISNGDSVAGPAMISPNMFRLFAKKYETRLANVVHECGADYILHICGNTTILLNDFSEMPMDAFELDYETDLQKIHDTLADKITFSGNLDPTDVIAHGTPQIVHKATQNLLDIYRDSSRLIVCSGCAISPDTPEENIRALVSTVRGTF